MGHVNLLSYLFHENKRADLCSSSPLVPLGSPFNRLYQCQHLQWILEYVTSSVISVSPHLKFSGLKQRFLVGGSSGSVGSDGVVFGLFVFIARMNIDEYFVPNSY